MATSLSLEAEIAYSQGKIREAITLNQQALAIAAATETPPLN